MLFILQNHLPLGFLMKQLVFGQHQLLIQLYNNTAILLKTTILVGMKLTLVGQLPIKKLLQVILDGMLVLKLGLPYN